MCLEGGVGAAGGEVAQDVVGLLALECGECVAVVVGECGECGEVAYLGVCVGFVGEAEDGVFLGPVVVGVSGEYVSFEALCVDVGGVCVGCSGLWLGGGGVEVFEWEDGGCAVGAEDECDAEEVAHFGEEFVECPVGQDVGVAHGDAGVGYDG